MSNKEDLFVKNGAKELLCYDKETGIFSWTIKRNGVTDKKKAGSVNSKGYICIIVNGLTFRAHRLAWLYAYGEFPPHHIDHINHIRHDNRIDNLRLATSIDNGKNRSMQKNNLSGITGIDWHKQSKKWRAKININGVSTHIGLFSEKNDAAKARKEAEIKYGFHDNHGLTNERI